MIVEKPLAAVSEVIMGQSPDGIHYNTSGDGWPLITGAGQFGEIYPKPTQYSREATRLSKVGDLILCIRATIGDLNWADNEYVVGRGVAAIRPGTSIDSHYLWHFLKTQKRNLSRYATGSTFKQIKSADVKQLIVPVPPLAEQKRIAGILDAADALRTKRREALAQLDTLLQATFLDLFGDPVTNQKRWDQPTVGEITLNVTDGKHGDCRPDETSGYYFVSVKDIRDGAIDYDHARQILYEDFEEVHKRTRLEPGDVLITNSGTIGRTAVIDEHPKVSRTTFQKSVAIVKPRKDRVDAMYLKYVLDFNVQHLGRTSTGSSQKNLLLGQLRSFQVALPPLAQQREFVDIARRIEQLRQSHRAHLAELDTLFASLQSRAFRGELDAG